MYAWIESNREKESVAYCCKVLQVGRTGYYRSIARQAQEDKNATVLSAVKGIHQAHPEYGTERVRVLLSEENRRSYGTIYKLRKKHGLLATKRRKPQGTTKRSEKDELSEDLVQRDFRAEDPGSKWLGDITQAKCKDGKLYIAGVMDCYDGALVGLSMNDNMKTALCTDALRSAVSRYGHPPGLIFHSDRGSQYTSREYRQTLEGYGIRQSMGRTGSCYDNARMESFWATLKKELLYRLPLSTMTKAEVRRAVFRWIECEYNLTRPYSANPDYLPPLKYRAKMMRQQDKRAA